MCIYVITYVCIYLIEHMLELFFVIVAILYSCWQHVFWSVFQLRVNVFFEFLLGLERFFSLFGLWSAKASSTYNVF